MKKILIIITLVFFAFNSQSQQVKNIGYKFSSEDYLKKSKGQRNTGFILLGGGAALFGIGCYALEHTHDKSGYGAFIMLGGMTMAATSIPFFIASLSSKHKAKIYMNKEALMISPEVKSGLAYNSIRIKINF
jgi:hypothetical protein